MAARVKISLQKRLEKCVRPLDNPNHVGDIACFLLETLPLVKEFLLLDRRETTSTNFSELENLFQIVGRNSSKQIIRLGSAGLFAGAYFHSGLRLSTLDIEKHGFGTENLDRIDDFISWLNRTYNLSKILPCNIENYKDLKIFKFYLTGHMEFHLIQSELDSLNGSRKNVSGKLWSELETGNDLPDFNEIPSAGRRFRS